MGVILCATDPGGLFLGIDLPDIFDMHDRQQKTLRVSESDGLAGFKVVGLHLVNIQADGYGPQQVVLQPHAIEHGFIIGTGHKARQR